ncbi:hypothetical protein ACJMK2_028189 [Sinanodonta woodiana]|uniref:Uncharacterized protein n=1 Tax=Sinanodonta woodiana TaxID=1069815 RepID=A0ABD3X9V4_SINWO
MNLGSNIKGNAHLKFSDVPTLVNTTSMSLAMRREETTSYILPIDAKYLVTITLVKLKRAINNKPIPSRRYEKSENIQPPNNTGKKTHTLEKALSSLNVHKQEKHM